METSTEVDVFDIFRAQLRQSMTAALSLCGPHLFTTDVPALDQTYLAGFPEGAQRQYHNCSCCKHFLRRYGGLVAIDSAGRRMSLWSHIDLSAVPPEFVVALTKLRNAVSKAKINGVFQASEAELGTAQTGEWSHFHVTLPTAMLHKRGVLTAGQKRAEQREEFGMLRRGLDEYAVTTFAGAVAMLQGDTLYRGEKFMKAAEALLALKTTVEATGAQAARDPFLWRAVAAMPAGFAHVKSSMIGTLLDDLQAGSPAAEVKARFDAKMAPLRYQRAQVPARAGNIVAAEKLVAALGIGPSLPRRFATLDEVLNKSFCRWTPTGTPGQAQPTVAKVVKTTAGVFSGLSGGAAPTVVAAPIPGARMSWLKFLQTVLPKLDALEFVPPSDEASYGAITTAVNADAPPIFLWDKPERRNPFSWYRWVGVKADEFGLMPGQPSTVLMVTDVPSKWTGFDAHEGSILILDGAADANVATAGLGLFPELLRADLKAVRATIDNHSMKEQLAAPPVGVNHVNGDPNDHNLANLKSAPVQLAAGLVLRKGAKMNCVLRGTTAAGSVIDYVVDRWE